jgi:hypothetical protein
MGINDKNIKYMGICVSERIYLLKDCMNNFVSLFVFIFFYILLYSKIYC